MCDAIALQEPARLLQHLFYFIAVKPNRALKHQQRYMLQQKEGKTMEFTLTNAAGNQPNWVEAGSRPRHQSLLVISSTSMLSPASNSSSSGSMVTWSHTATAILLYAATYNADAVCHQYSSEWVPVTRVPMKIRPRVQVTTNRKSYRWNLMVPLWALYSDPY